MFHELSVTTFWYLLHEKLQFNAKVYAHDVVDCVPKNINDLLQDCSIFIASAL